MKLIRHIFFMAILAISAGTQAQRTTGSWTSYSVSRPADITQFTESPSTIFYLSGNRVHAMDRNSRAVHLYGADDMLNGVYIKQIKYNPAGAYLAVAGLHGALYTIFDNGTVKAVPAVENMRTSMSREINDIDFDGNNAVIAGDFGLAVIDMTNGTVKNSGIYPSKVGSNEFSGGFNSVCVAGDRIYAIAANGDMYSASLKNSLASTGALKKVNKKFTPGTRLTGIADKELLADNQYAPAYTGTNDGNRILHLKVADDFASVTATNLIASYGLSWKSGSSIYAVGVADGQSVPAVFSITGTSANKILDVPADLRKAHKYAKYDYDGLAAKLYSQVTASPWSNGLIWFSGTNGLSAYKDNASSPAVAAFIPTPDVPYTSISNIHIMRPSADGSRLLLSSRSSAKDFPYSHGTVYNPYILFNSYEAYVTQPVKYWGWFNPGYFSSIEADGSVKDLTVYDAMNYMGSTTNASGTPYTNSVWNCGSRVIAGPESIVENPSQPGDLWIASCAEGLYRITPDGKQHIYSTPRGNLHAKSSWGALILDAQFDNEGNLWILGATPGLVWYPTSNYPGDVPALQMLPAAKVNGDPEAITKEDWIFPNNFPVTSDSPRVWGDGSLAHVNTPDGSEFFFIQSDRQRKQLAAYKRRSSGADVSQDEYYMFTHFSDGRNTMEITSLMNSIYADREGRLWLTNGNVLLYVSDFSSITPGQTVLPVTFASTEGEAGGMTASPIKGQAIIGMSQASDGTMWFATAYGGLYHTDRNATKVLETFNSSNSPLPDHFLNMVHEGPDGRIYVGSHEGLYAYDPGKSPSAPNLDNVTVMPAVVEPGYTGHFSISGLTDGCSVNIVDAYGSSVHKAVSSGGVLIWNGLDTNGDRITPGAYYINAGSPTQTVAKIIIID